MSTTIIYVDAQKIEQNIVNARHIVKNAFIDTSSTVNTVTHSGCSFLSLAVDCCTKDLQRETG